MDVSDIHSGEKRYFQKKLILFLIFMLNFAIWISITLKVEFVAESFNLMNGQISNLNRSKNAVPVKNSALCMFHFICQKDSKIAINIEMS